MLKIGFPSYLLRAGCAVAFAAVITGASAQTASTELSFEAATVKPIDPSYRFDGKRHWAHVFPTRSSYWYMSVDSLFSYAYGLASYQVAGKDWTSVEHFDIEATFPEGAGKKDEKQMLQSLLKDRFRLSFHTEQRELDSYVLVVGKHGEKLKPSLDLAEPAPVVTDGSTKSRVTNNADGSSTVDLGRFGTQTIRVDRENLALHYERSRMTMEDLASGLAICLGRGPHVIVDETGLKGTYQVAYDCPMSIAPQAPAASETVAPVASDPQGSSVLTRSLDAQGLKLEKRKMVREVYVIDHVEHPSEN